MEEGLVIGFRFLPTDQELLECLLYERVTTGVPLLDCPNVYEDDFYGKSTEVLEIWNQFGGPQLERNSVGMEGDLDLFVFTHLLKKATSRKKFIRTVGTGCWEGENSSEPVIGADGSVLGSKKRFKYSNKKNSQVDGLWSMIEFSLAGSYFLDQNPNISTDLVLCRIRKGKTSTKKRKFQDITQQQQLPCNITQSTGNNYVMMLEAPNLGNEAVPIMSQRINETFTTQSTTYDQDNLFSNINESTSFQAPISQQTINETFTTQWTTYDQDDLFANINESTFQAPISQQINNETFTTQSTSTYDQDDSLLNITEDDIEELKQALNWTTENSMEQGGVLPNNDEQAAKSSNELAFATQWTRNDDHHQGDSLISNDIFATQSADCGEYDDIFDIPPKWKYML